MFKSLKKPRFPHLIFICASLAALILLPVLVLTLKAMIAPASPITDKYFLKEQPLNDPLVTKIPDLKDILSGPIITEADPSVGPEDAPITIVQFSDFKCSFCQKQEEVLKNILDEFDGKIRLVWKDYPENDSQSMSWKASIAARCAEEQDKFWPYHDLLFSTTKLDEEKLLDFAGKLSLNKNKFQACLESNDISNKVKDNVLEADALDINGVPYIYVNDTEFIGEITAEELRTVINSKLKS